MKLADLNVFARSVFEGEGRHRRAAVVGTVVVVLLAVVFVVTRVTERRPLSDQSELRVRPVRPRMGDTLRITYRPALTSFEPERRLMLRARLRTSHDDMYGRTIPGSRVRAVVQLDRRPDGSYGGRFVLPDSIVYATLVVEDDAGEHLDDNFGRGWEILTYAADERPTYDALNQRANDMMGRSWEEAYASSLQLSTLYPNRVSAWLLREFFDREMFGGPVADSLIRGYEAKIDSLINTRKTVPRLEDDEIGGIFFRQWSKVRRGGSARDSAEFRYWRDRLFREYPRHAQVGQYYAISFRPEDWKRPAWMLDSLERLYSKLAPLSGPAFALVHDGVQLASQSKDDAVFRRWIERSFSGSPDSVYRVALAITSRPSLRADGERALRALLSSPSDQLVPFRRLAETQGDYASRVDDARRNVLMALGVALAADGRTGAAIDTLRRAADGAWNLEVFHALTAAYLTANDTAAADRIRARVVVDPGTPSNSATSIGAAARARVGAAGWDSLLTSARNEMHQRILARSKIQGVRGAPHLETASGTALALRAITGKKAAAVIFWSHECGAALQALPAISRVAERLRKEGIPVVFIAGDHPSAEVNAYLAQQGWTLPVYYDAAGEMKNAFVVFGTPSYFSMDAAGRIRFDAVRSDETELIGQLESLQAENLP